MTTVTHSRVTDNRPLRRPLRYLDSLLSRLRQYGLPIAQRRTANGKTKFNSAY